MVTIFIGISGLGPSGSPVYSGGNGFHAAFGRAADLNIFKGMPGLPFGITDTSARIKLFAQGYGGRGDVFYPRDDYFPAACLPVTRYW